MTISWTVHALVSLEAIGDYIAKDNAQAAREIIRTIKDMVGMLSDQPGLGHSGRIRNTFELVVVGLPYIIIYVLGEKNVKIISIFDKNRGKLWNHL